MKKILIVFLFISLPLLVNAQLTGDGTYANPWSGTLAGDATWSGTKYINGDITVDNEKLTISAGAIIIFLSEGTDLIITGTGQLEANGSSGNMIRFTSDDDNDGSYGETGERWGHISFQGMGSAGPSLFNYCIIEYGDVRTAGSTDDPYKYGGAIHAAFSNLTISNCLLQNNKAKWGGALFVNKNYSPYIKNCHILNNESVRAGGGFYLWDGSAPVIENCIFEKNICSEATHNIYSGGGLCAQTNSSVKVLNCTFVNNTTTRPNGAGIELYSSNNARIINTIFWGSSIEVFLSATNGNTLINCGIQSSVPTGAVNCIVLNPSNSDAAGPNFNATDGSDWSIKFISPCRDAGINSYTGVTIPSTDYAYHPRIYTVDIGAYEVQYSRWTGSTSTSWSTTSNWESNIDPSSGSGDVIIPSSLSTYPVNSSNPAFTIGTGKQMILNPGAKVTLSSLTNNGTLRLESDASNISSLIINSFSGTNATVELYLTGGGTKTTYKWHYISTPVSSLPVSTFTTVTPDIVRYYDSRVTTDLVQGWVAQDGWIYATGSFGGPTFTTLTPGRGYDFYDSANNKFTFSGELNTADVPMALEFNGGANNGFNLLGNPFSCGLDWDYIISQPGYPTNTSKGLYFTRDNTLCSYIAGVGSPSDVNAFIPPMQGFFTKTYATGKTITLAAAAKTHSIHARYKGSEIIPLIRLSLADDTLSDETVVRFDEKASATLDNDYDALKIFYSTENTEIYSVTDGSKYVINGQPFPDTAVTIPVGINILASGIHSVSATQLQGLDNYGVYLKDNVTGFTADLKTNPVVTFTASAGSIPNRFILKITNSATGIEEKNISKTSFNIFQGLGFINIQPLADDWDGLQGSVTIFDMTGRKVTDLRNTEFIKNSLVRVQSPDIKGIYIVELKSGVKRYTGKVVIK